MLIPKYNKEDQATLDAAGSRLEKYNTCLINALQKTELSPQEIHESFLNDPAKQTLEKSVIDIHRVLVPTHFIVKRDPKFSPISDDLYKEAFAVSKAFIDSHAADPDLTTEMCDRYDEYQETLKKVEAKYK